MNIAATLFLLSSAIQLTVAVYHEAKAAQDNKKSPEIPEHMYDFLATRGRRDNDLFWANRGRRSSSRLKPNGFIFVMGKRAEGGDPKKIIIEPNGFNFPLAGKRGARLIPNSFNIPLKRDGQSFDSLMLKPQYFGQFTDDLFDSNLPRPIGLMLSDGGEKRDDSKTVWKNMVRPNGFIFSMARGKKSDEDIIDSIKDYEDQHDVTYDDWNIINHKFEMKRSDMDDLFISDPSRTTYNKDIFVAGRG